MTAASIAGLKIEVDQKEPGQNVRCVEKAVSFLTSAVERGGDVLFVGTKAQAQETVRDAASRTAMYYVNTHWLGGMLTNFETIRKSVQRYQKLNMMKEDGTFKKFTKKEAAVLTKEIARFEKNFSGIVEMTKLPAAMVAVDSKHEVIAIREAVRLGIPVVAIVDTDSDPDLVQYPVPGNEDAIRSIVCLMNFLVAGILEGKGRRKSGAQGLPEGAQKASAAKA